MPILKPLTKKERKVLDVILKLREVTEYISLSDIQKVMKFKYRSLADYYVTSIIKKGWLKRSGRRLNHV